MSNLQVSQVMMSSLEIQQVIAELAKDTASGVKVAKPHSDILKDIRKQLFSLEGNIPIVNSDSYVIEEIDTYKGKETKQIWLNQEETEILITGYSTPIRRAVLKKLRDKIAELESKQTKPLPSNYKEALLALVASEEEKERLQLEKQKATSQIVLLEGKIEEDKPKVAQWEQFLDSKGLMAMGDAAKMFGLGRTKFFSLLREEKIIQKKLTTPYQRFVDQGLFVVIASSNESWSGSVTKITAKGLDYISKVLKIQRP